MGLALGVKQFGSVFIEDTRAVVTMINDDKSFRLTIGKNDYNITFKRPGVEVYPEVRVYADINKNHDHDMVSVIVDAPKRIQILRGKLYWQEKEDREIEVEDG